MSNGGERNNGLKKRRFREREQKRGSCILCRSNRTVIARASSLRVGRHNLRPCLPEITNLINSVLCRTHTLRIRITLSGFDRVLHARLKCKGLAAISCIFLMIFFYVVGPFVGNPFVVCFFFYFFLLELYFRIFSSSYY